MAKDYRRDYKQNRDYAVQLARHYLRHSFNPKYTVDQDAEMACFVDAIIDAAVSFALGVIDETVQALAGEEVEGE